MAVAIGDHDRLSRVPGFPIGMPAVVRVSLTSWIDEMAAAPAIPGQAVCLERCAGLRLQACAPGSVDSRPAVLRRVCWFFSGPRELDDNFRCSFPATDSRPSGYQGLLRERCRRVERP